MSIAAPAPKANMGQPIPRYDAVAKVTGKAQYAADVALVNPAYAYLVTSSIAKGRIDSFDLTPPNRFRGVIDIVTHENAEKLKEAKLFSNGGYTSTTIQPLKSADIAQEGQIVAVVLAETLRSRARSGHAGQGELHRGRADHDIRFTGHDVGARQGAARAIQGRSESRRLRQGVRRRRSQDHAPRMKPRPSITIRWSCSRPVASGTATI